MREYDRSMHYDHDVYNRRCIFSIKSRVNIEETVDEALWEVGERRGQVISRWSGQLLSKGMYQQ